MADGVTLLEALEYAERALRTGATEHDCEQCRADAAVLLAVLDAEPADPTLGPVVAKLERLAGVVSTYSDMSTLDGVANDLLDVARKLRHMEVA